MLLSYSPYLISCTLKKLDIIFFFKPKHTTKTGKPKQTMNFFLILFFLRKKGSITMNLFSSSPSAEATARSTAIETATASATASAEASTAASAASAPAKAAAATTTSAEAATATASTTAAAKASTTAAAKASTTAAAKATAFPCGTAGRLGRLGLGQELGEGEQLVRADEDLVVGLERVGDKALAHLDGKVLCR